MAAYRLRLMDRFLTELLAELPAVLLVGPRATGKTTTAVRHAATVVRLDRPAEAVAFQADPDAALRGWKEPILLDEWQAVPEVLGAVKRSVDADPRPGRFLLTGSVRADLEAQTWPGTGRVVRLAMGPLTVGERLGRPSVALVDRIAASTPLEPGPGNPDLRTYIDLALASGFPEATFMGNFEVRRRWIESYLDQLLTRDAAGLETNRDPARLRRYFEAYALNTAGIVTDRTLQEAAGIDRRTAAAYERLLTNLMVIDALPAWSSNRLKRLTQLPCRHLVDPGFLVGSTGVDTNAVLREGALLGRILESFVAMHLRVETVIARSRPRLYHLRTEQGRQEIDLLAEIGSGSVIGIEVKATSAPGADDARHLAWLGERLGERFLGGVVLHTGLRSFSLGKGLFAAPISTLWA